MKRSQEFQQRFLELKDGQRIADDVLKRKHNRVYEFSFAQSFFQ